MYDLLILQNFANKTRQPLTDNVKTVKELNWSITVCDVEESNDAGAWATQGAAISSKSLWWKVLLIRGRILFHEVRLLRCYRIGYPDRGFVLPITELSSTTGAQSVDVNRTMKLQSR